jgi:hypothetical protein
MRFLLQEEQATRLLSILHGRQKWPLHRGGGAKWRSRP